MGKEKEGNEVGMKHIIILIYRGSATYIKALGLLK